VTPRTNTGRHDQTHSCAVHRASPDRNWRVSVVDDAQSGGTSLTTGVIGGPVSATVPAPVVFPVLIVRCRRTDEAMTPLIAATHSRGESRA